MSAGAKLAFSLGDVMPLSSFVSADCPGGSWVMLNAGNHNGAAAIVWRMAGDERSPKQEALAKFIVNACNAHEELVAALTRAVHSGIIDFDGEPELARAALAKAGVA